MNRWFLPYSFFDVTSRATGLSYWRDFAPQGPSKGAGGQYQTDEAALLAYVRRFTHLADPSVVKLMLRRARAMKKNADRRLQEAESKVKTLEQFMVELVPRSREERAQEVSETLDQIA